MDEYLLLLLLLLLLLNLFSKKETEAYTDYEICLKSTSQPAAKPDFKAELSGTQEETECKKERKTSGKQSHGGGERVP